MTATKIHPLLAAAIETKDSYLLEVYADHLADMGDPLSEGWRKIVSVPWFVDDDQMPHYRSCDFCDYRATDELKAATAAMWNPDKCRAFFWRDGYSACEKCISLLAEDEPQGRQHREMPCSMSALR